MNYVWQLKTPASAVVFDCDSTLSTIEGIDVLAEFTGVSAIVKSLTEEAMSRSGLNPAFYQQRMDLVKPAQQQVENLVQQYFAHKTPDAGEVINILQQCNKSIYLVSSGLLPAVEKFGKLLSIPEKNIFAVDVQFDANGNYLTFDTTSPLIKNDGKRIIIHQIKQEHSNIVYIGDGLNDYAVHDLVMRFIGYGGAAYREKVARVCQYYINTPSMASLLPLSLTENEYSKLPSDALKIYQQGLLSINRGQIKVSVSD